MIDPMEGTTVFKRSSKARDARDRKLSLKFKDRSVFVPKKFLIGRSAFCRISLPHDALVSRRHAVIEFSQGEYCIKDLDSTNGTYVNNRPLQKGERRILRAGDVIIVGKTEMKIDSVPDR
jgi:pSer/pThr/pTyr-binding forkhead associated (FHA) protein